MSRLEFWEEVPPLASTRAHDERSNSGTVKLDQPIRIEEVRAAPAAPADAHSPATDD